MKASHHWALALGLLGASVACAQESWQTQGVVEGNLPASWQALKSQMRYPDSWLSGQYGDFARWQSHSRQLVRQALLTPDSTRPFSPQTLSEEDRGSYKRKSWRSISPTITVLRRSC